jgi:hypothetical protein
MKKTIAIVASVLAAVSGYAQGTLDFRNFVAGSVDAPVFVVLDGGGTAKAEGAGFLAQLYAGPSEAALAPIGAAVPFRTGTGAGYWNPAPSAARTVDTVAAGAEATVKVVAWNTAVGATWDAAKAANLGGIGESTVFKVKTGGSGEPPSLPANLVGLTSFNISAVVPEPSIVALGVLGGLALLLRRRE